MRRHLPSLLLSAIVLLFLIALLLLLRAVVATWHLPPDPYHDAQFMAWVGVATQAAGAAATLLAVVFLLFLNIIVENYRQPRLEITCGTAAPWQRPSHSSSSRLHVRLLVRNAGRSVETACEVRVESVERLPKDARAAPTSIDSHDPRPLKWVGRSTQPIALSIGAFDLVDLGVREEEFPDVFRLEFADRGHIDLSIEDGNARGFRVRGTVYGSQSRPKSFRFDLTWLPIRELDHIDIREV